jgi:glycosyltransferase involved in cell wall biosynthesis
LVSEAVASALAQEWDPLEVIVVDDASSDDTVERLRALASADGRLRVIARERNGGESAARNQGILAASQDYVALLDSDNSFMPQKLSRQMTSLLAGPADAMSFSAYVLAEDGIESAIVLDHWQSAPDAVVEALLMACVVNTSTFLGPRAILADQGLFRTDLVCCQDHDLWLRLAALGHAFLYEPEPLTLYRMHGGSISSDAARVAKYEELVIGDFLARPDLPKQVTQRAGYWRARWALAGAGRFLEAGMPDAALRALGRAALASPRSIRAGWLLLALRAMRDSAQLRLGVGSASHSGSSPPPRDGA